MKAIFVLAWRALIMWKCQQGKCSLADRYYPGINMDTQIQIEASTTIEAEINTERERE